MKIFVCVKHVPDSAARIEITGPIAYDEGVTFIMNPYDENAVEAAVQIAEQQPQTEVVAVTVGNERAVDALRTAMAMGADRSILVRTADKPDSMATAKALAAAIRHDGDGEIVFTGRVAIDSEGMQTMFHLAGELKRPVATNVVALDLGPDGIQAQRQVDARCREVLHLPLPCVIATGKALNTPRYPKFPDIVKARKKPVATIDLTDLEPAPSDAAVRLVALEPVVENRRKKVLEGSPAEAVAQLVEVLAEVEKVI